MYEQAKRDCHCNCGCELSCVLPGHGITPKATQEDVVDKLIARLEAHKAQRAGQHGGKTLKSFSGTDMHAEALEQALDLCIYLMGMKMEAVTPQAARKPLITNARPPRNPGDDTHSLEGDSKQVHEEGCESEFIVEAGAWTPCRCGMCMCPRCGGLEGQHVDRACLRGLFRKKPVVVKARLYTGTNSRELMDWMRDHGTFSWLENGDLVIKTLEGFMNASPGYWIAQGGKVKEFWAVRGDIFADTYERVEQDG